MYSQGEEERAILEWFGPRTGRFLDIGAFNGITHSNTRALFERGWGGVLVEPNPSSFLGLMEAYAGIDRVQLVNAAIGAKPALVKFWSCKGEDSVSTMDEGRYKRWAGRVEIPYQEIWVSCVTPRQLRKRFPGPFNFVSIDAEGMDLAVFNRMDFTAVELVCVEKRGVRRKLRARAARLGMKVVHETEWNLVLGVRD